MPIDFEALYREHYERIYTYLFFKTGSREDAADLAQDTFLRLWQHRETMPTVAHSWLYTVAKHLFLDQAAHQAVTKKRGNLGSFEALEMEPCDEADFTALVAELDEREQRVAALKPMYQATIAQLLLGREAHKMAVYRMRKAYHALEEAGV